MIVLDASAILEVLLARPVSEAVHERIRAEEGRVHVPHVIDLEVAQVLRRYQLRGDLSAERAWESLVLFATYDLTRYPHTLLLPRIWQLRDNFTAYDAAYVALAETLEAPLVTTDVRLARATGHSATVEVVA